MEQQAALALYRPQAGQEAKLGELVAGHAPLLRKLGLLSDGPSVLMRTAGGTLVEVLRWRSLEAARHAGADPDVRRLWQDINQISDSPGIDANPQPPTDGSRFLSVTLAPRSSDSDLESQPRLGWLATVVGALSFIPLAGAPLAVIAVIWGFLTKKRGANRLIALGIGGLAVSIVAVAAFVAFKTYDLPFGPAKQMMTQMHLASAVQAVEFHKVQTGRYPDALTDLRESLPRTATPFMFDPGQMWAMNPRPFYYERIDADHYYLLGVGADGQPFTADDVVPEIDIKPGSHVGLTVKR